MATTYERDPNSLNVLKKFLLPNGDVVSPNVVEGDPELALPLPSNTSMAEQAGLERTKQMLGLGPSPALRKQQAELDARDQAINQARISAEPDVAAQTEAEQKRKMALAGEPNRVSGNTAITVEQMKNDAAAKLEADRQAQVERVLGASNSGFKPSINASGGVSFAPDPLNAQEQALTDSAHAITNLGVPLLQKFEAKYPGISQDPQKYGSPFSDTLTEKFGKGIYSFGGMTNNDELLQDAATIQAWGMRALMSGRINKQMMDLINGHLPQPGFSPGANYDRLRRLVTDILPAQMSGISDARSGQPLKSPVDPYANPEYQPR